MATIRIDPSAPGPQAIAHAASVIKRGGLVAFPTETVYGLGANALDERAVARIFEAKGRPSFNPLIVHVPDAATARDYAASWPPAAGALATAFWPGPLTLVLPKRRAIPDIVTAGLPSVALRVPSHPVARALLEAAGVPIAAPSANRYTQLSPTDARHVEDALGDMVELVLDAGPTRVGIESTVIDLTGPVPVLLRPGTLHPRALTEVAGSLSIPPEDVVDEGTVRSSPGMGARHYAPRAVVHLFTTSDSAVATTLARSTVMKGGAVGALLLEPLDAPIQHLVRMPADPAAYAHTLYAALHDLDSAGCELVLIESVPEDEAWAGVRDRLTRAARSS